MNLEMHIKKISLAFYILAGYLGVSILYAFTGGDLTLFGPGIFLFRCFHVLALFIPVYCVLTGLSLVETPISLQKVFRLNLLVFPFFTLALFVHILRGAVEIPVVQSFTIAFGKVVGSLLFLFLSGLEVLIILKVSSQFLTDERLSRFFKSRERFERGTERSPQASEEHYAAPESSPVDINVPFSAPSAPEPVRPVSPEELGLSANGDPAISSMIQRIINGEQISSEELEAISNPVEEDPAIRFLSNEEPAVVSSSAGIEDEYDLLDDDAVYRNENVEDEEKLDNLIHSLDSVLDSDSISEEPLQEDLNAKLSPKIYREDAFAETSVPVKKKRRKYSIPVEGILNEYPDSSFGEIDEDTQKAARALEETLEEFKISAKVTGIRRGPVITMFELVPSSGVKLSRIVNLQDNIAFRLAASSVRIVAPIPGRHAVGIEVPNKKRNLVSYSSILKENATDVKKMSLPFFLGKDIQGGNQVVDLTRTPHLLIAGSTGSGKSVCVNSLICSILYECHPSDVKLILVDPKIVELKLYNDIPHLLTPVVTETKRALQALQWCLYEMERRYSLLDAMAVRNIKTFNKKIKEQNIATEKMPYIVVIIDEFADLMATAGKELEGIVARLAAMSRAVGIHLVLATQRPSTDVITGLIKANFPSRIAFMVASKVDSRIIIDNNGAEKLLGRGDMLFTSSWDPFPTRLQGAFLSEEEVERVVEQVRAFGAPEYIDDEIFVDDEEDDQMHLFGDSGDPIYDKALEIVSSSGKASASYLQRRLKIGYNRAARLIEEMEDRGIVGPQNGSKPRDVLIGGLDSRHHDQPSMA